MKKYILEKQSLFLYFVFEINPKSNFRCLVFGSNFMIECAEFINDNGELYVEKPKKEVEVFVSNSTQPFILN